MVSKGGLMYFGPAATGNNKFNFQVTGLSFRKRKPSALRSHIKVDSKQEVDLANSSQESVVNKFLVKPLRRETNNRLPKITTSEL